MDHLQPYLDYFSLHPGWAVAIVFLIAFGEALLIIGLFVPSTVVLVGAGMLVGTGHLNFWPVFLATAIGAIAGDQVSYWAGRLYGQRLKTLWPLNLYPQLVARGEDFIRSHGGKSIAIGRFVPGVKAVVPGIVGMFGMSQAYFATINVASGIVWTAAHVFPGILLGQGLALAGELSGRLGIVLVILLLILAVAGYAIRLIAAGLSPYLSHVLGKISVWARNRRSRPLRRFSRAISPRNPRSTVIVFFAIIFIACMIGLIIMVSGLMVRDAVSNADVSIFNLMSEMRNAPADEIMITLSMGGDGMVLAAMIAVTLLWLIWRGAYRAAIAAAIVFVAGSLFVTLIKYVIQRPPPVEVHAAFEAFAFPSGHATMAALAFGVVAVLVSHSMGRWGRSIVIATCGIAVIAISYSRVYLGVHWLSDVIGGLLFGTIMTAAFAVAIEAFPPRRVKPLGLFGATLIAFIAAGAFHVSRDYALAEQTYAPQQRTEHTDLDQWRQGGWKRLPARRIDLAGKPEELFLVQWAGSLDPLKSILVSAGWIDTPKWTWRESLPYLDPHAELMGLLPRPSLHEGLKAKITLMRPLAGDSNRREVIRAFKTHIELTDGGIAQPIYLVSLTQEQLRKGLNLYAVPSPLPADSRELTEMLKIIGAAPGLRVLAENADAGATPALVLATP